MNDEEIDMLIANAEYEPQQLKDYITNLQQENERLKWDKEQLNSLVNSCQEEIRKLKEENERLKQELNCKEYFSSTMPENTEFVILTKNNYDRQQKDIQLELIDYKSRIEKAVEYIENNEVCCLEYIGRNEITGNLEKQIQRDLVNRTDLLNILNGRSDE